MVETWLLLGSAGCSVLGCGALQHVTDFAVVVCSTPLDSMVREQDVSPIGDAARRR